MPPSDTTKLNQYPWRLAALGVAKGLSPNTPRRNYLMIQNQSVNEVRLQFGRPANNDSDIRIGGGQTLEWDDKVPQGSINLFSTLATFGMIGEGLGD